MKASGVVLWSGLSRITSGAKSGARIVAVATFKTSNRKTGKGDARRTLGALAQTWILLESVSPVEAVRRAMDVHICGACVHRGNAKAGRRRSCYVNVGQAPAAVWKAYKAGRYATEWTPEMFRGVKIRLGAYGDPAAVPAHIWADVLRYSAGHTGYSHQWRNPRLRDVLQWCQASTDSADDVARVRALPVIGQTAGSFRVLRDGESLLPGEFYCPSETGVTCAECMACDGSGALVAISAHGSGAKNYA